MTNLLFSFITEKQIQQEAHLSVLINFFLQAFYNANKMNKVKINIPRIAGDGGELHVLTVVCHT